MSEKSKPSAQGRDRSTSVSTRDTRDIYKNYENYLKGIVESGVIDEEEASLLFFPSDNIRIDSKSIPRCEGEKTSPDGVSVSKLPLYTQKNIQYFTSERSRVVQQYKAFKKIDVSSLKFEKEKFEVDKIVLSKDPKDNEDKGEKKKPKVKRKNEFIKPSVPKTRTLIRKHLIPNFFHLFNKAHSEEEYDWNGGAEKQLCKRKPVKKLRDLSKINFLVSIKSFETTFQEKYGDVEPLFLEMALYDLENKRKLTETYHFDFNSPEIVNMISMGAKYDDSNFKNKALFKLKSRSNDIVLIVIVSKVLEGVSEDQACERYVKPLKFKDGDFKKLKKNVPQFCERFGFIRQPVCYTMIPVFEDDEVILGSEEHQVFYRTSGNANFLTMIGEEKQKKMTGTGSRRLKVVPARLTTEIIELKDDFKQIYKDDGIVSINNKVEVQEVVYFPLDQKLENNDNYMHYLYINPKSLMSKKITSSKNIVVKVQIKTNDEDINDKDNAMTIIFGKSSQEVFVKESYTKISVGKKNPEFNDEFKIKLPAIIKSNYHVLFSFYQVNNRLTSKKSTLQIIGHSFIPLVDEKKRIIDGLKELTVATDVLNDGANYTANGMIKKGYEKIFKVKFKAMSTIYPTEKNIASFFINPQKNVLKVLKAFEKDKVGIIRIIPPLFNQLFEILCNCLDNKVLTETFHVLVELVHQISTYMGETMYCESLWYYVDNIFVNSSATNISLPFFQVAHLWLSLIKDGQAKRKIKAKVSKGKVFYHSLRYSWFFFEIIYKSIVLFLQKAKSKGRLNNKQFSNILTTFVEVISVEMEFRLNELAIAQDLNHKLALFLRDLFAVMDRGQVLVLIDSYLSAINKITVQKAIVQEMAINFCKIICDFEHYVPLSLPRNFQITGVNVEKSLFNLSFLCGIITKQCIRDCTYKERTIRERCFGLIKDILTKHEHDRRYETEKKRIIIAGMYFPFILFFLENFDDFVKISESNLENSKKRMKEAQDDLDKLQYQLDEAKEKSESYENSHSKKFTNFEELEKKIVEQRRKVDDGERDFEEEKSRVKQEREIVFVCLMSILSKMNRDSLVKWCQTETSRKVFLFFNILKSSLDLFEYVGENEILERERKFGVAYSTNKAIAEAKKHIESLYNFGNFAARGRGARTVKLRDRRRKSSLNKRHSLSRGLRRSLGSKRHTGTITKFSEEELLERVKFQGILASNISIAVLDILLDLIKVFDYSVEYMTKIFDIILTFFDTNQSDHVLLCFFPFLKSFMEIYRPKLYVNETPYSEKLCMALMKKCCSVSSKIRGRATGCLYLLIKFNYLELGNFTRTKIQTTTTLSKVVNNLDSDGVERLSSCFTLIAEYAKNDSEVKLSNTTQRKMKKKSATFAQQISTLVERLQTTLLDTRKISQFRKDETQHEKLIELYLKLAEGSKDASPELCVMWYDSLSNFYEEVKKCFVEAAQCKLYIAATVFQYFLLKNNPVFKSLDFGLLKKCCPILERETFSELKDLFKESTSTFASNKFTINGFIDLIKKAISLFGKSRYYEYTMYLHKLLEQYYLYLKDYNTLKTIYNELVGCCNLISKFKNQSRLFGTYYLIHFEGARWDDKRKGRSYVYKMPKLSRLSDVMEFIRRVFGTKFGKENIIISSSIARISDEQKTDKNKAIFLIQNVQPYKKDIDEEALYFERNTDFKYFIYETPFTKSKKSHGDIEDQYLRKTIIEVNNPFPCLETRNLVVNQDDVVLTPIENAVEIIAKKVTRIKQFKKDEAERKIDVNSLQMVLAGTLTPQVQAGVPSIINVFLGSKYVQDSNEDIQGHIVSLKNKLKEFLEVCITGLRMNSKYSNLRKKLSRELHEELVKGYKKIYRLISTKIEDIDNIGRDFIAYLDPTIDRSKIKINLFDTLFQESFEKFFAQYNTKN